MLNILAISGSLRKDSFNRKLLQVAKKIASDSGAQVKEFDLKENSLPIFDQDISNPMPESVKKIMEESSWADMFLIASPEYNHSISGALKNAIDWMSLDYEKTMKGKWASIFGASTGIYGTLRGQAHLREILSALSVSVISQPEVLVGLVDGKFDTQGNLTDEKTLKVLQDNINKTISLCLANKNN